MNLCCQLFGALCIIAVVANPTLHNQYEIKQPTDKPIENLFASSITNQQEPSNADNCKCVPAYLCSNTTVNLETGEGLIDKRTKESPCDDHSQDCCAPPSSTTCCGKRNRNGIGSLRITGAEDEAQFGEFPWMVAVIRVQEVDNNKSLVYQCGGSLIHPQAVMTAAHCVKGKKDLMARVGELDTQHKNVASPTQTMKVKEIVIHEMYYAGGAHNDMALLLLESPVNLKENVGLVCLPQQGVTFNNRDCVVSGWGKDAFGYEGEYQTILKKVELPIVDRKTCTEELQKTSLGFGFQLHSSFICAGGVPGKDTCKGDGGSPLVCPSPSNPDVYYQAGIVAWGIRCGTTTPGLYVDVAQFRSWIDNRLDLWGLSKTERS